MHLFVMINGLPEHEQLVESQTLLEETIQRVRSLQIAAADGCKDAVQTCTDLCMQLAKDAGSFVRESREKSCRIEELKLLLHPVPKLRHCRIGPL
jgi:hypothetical protein